MTTINVKTLSKQLDVWQSETIYFDADAYFNRVILGIKQATESIVIESYIFDLDAVGLQFVNALADAARRGVTVRIIIDGYGSFGWRNENISQLSSSGVALKIYHPLPWRLSFYDNAIIKKNTFAKLIYLVSRLNKRNHHKLCIIDNKRVFSGSYNVSATHLYHQSGYCNWLDCGVEITGESVKKLRSSFDEIWRGFGLNGKMSNRLPFRTNNTPLRRFRKNSELAQLICSCRGKIWITNAYLAPSRRIVNALKAAKSHGADVQILVSSLSDVPVYPLASTVYYLDLLAAGVKIHEFSQGFIHSKTILFDDLAMIGSSNLNHRSFLHDLELDIILTQESSKQELTKKFEQLIGSSTRVTKSQLSRQPWHKKILGKILWRLRYWF